MKQIFGRDAAFWLSLTSAAIAFISATVAPLSVEQQGVLNAGVAAVLGLASIGFLAAEKSVAAVVSVFKALIAIGLAFGWSLSPEVQSSAMVLVELVLTGVLVRPNVVSKVPPKEAVLGADGVHDISSLRRSTA
jgi:hypothetical protein